MRQRPGTAKGITFVTLEDETGIANLIVHARVWKRYELAARRATALIAQGRLERKDRVVHVIVQPAGRHAVDGWRSCGIARGIFGEAKTPARFQEFDSPCLALSGEPAASPPLESSQWSRTLLKADCADYRIAARLRPTSPARQGFAASDGGGHNGGKGDSRPLAVHDGARLSLGTGLAIAVCALAAAPAHAYVLDDLDATPWWEETATNKPTGGLGAPVTVTWSLAPDGTGITGIPSNLISFLNAHWGVHPVETAFDQQPWFFLFEESFARLSAVSGVTFLYEPNDDGITPTPALGRTFSNAQAAAGMLGVRGDVRIGGKSFLPDALDAGRHVLPRLRRDDDQHRSGELLLQHLRELPVSYATR